MTTSPPRRLVDDLVELVRIDSQNPGALEGACAAWVERRLSAGGVPVTRREAHDGRPNLIAGVRGSGTGPRLVLLAHMDTVPVGDHWTVPPLEGIVRDGAVWGRGAADMKAGLAVAIATLTTLASGPRPAADVVLCATVDEEGPDMRGIHALVAGGDVRGDDQVLALEPTGLRLRLAQVGLRWMEVVVHGRMAHAGRAHRDGIDANHIAARIAVELERRVPALAPEHPLLGPPRMTCGEIHGGVAVNVVPGSCTLRLDIRVVPPVAPAHAEALVREVAGEVARDFPGCDVEVRPLGVARPPVVADEVSDIVRRLRGTFEAELGVALEHGGEDGHEAYTDASMVAALTGSRSCTVWGPGHPDQAHVADERVTLAELAQAERVLTRLARGWGRSAP